MNGLSVVAIAAMVIGLPEMAGLQTREVGPSLNLAARRAHIRLYLKEAPDLRFYERKNLLGAPAIHVNERGAFVGSTLVCSWPEGRYDQQNESNMVLGYATGPEVGSSRYIRCPDGFPVISTWGDRGKGAAALFIEVFSRTGRIVEVRFRDRSFYFDLNALPGDPRDPAEVPGSMFLTGPPASSFDVRMKGFLGWQWEISEEEAARLKARAVNRLRRQPAFARFLRDVRRCLGVAQTPACLVPFLAETLSNEHGDSVTATQFADLAWREIDSEGRRRWTDLEECFLSEDLDASDTAARFATLNGWNCDLALGKTGWKLTDAFQGD